MYFTKEDTLNAIPINNQLNYHNNWNVWNISAFAFVLLFCQSTPTEWHLKLMKTDENVRDKTHTFSV